MWQFAYYILIHNVESKFSEKISYSLWSKAQWLQFTLHCIVSLNTCSFPGFVFSNAICFLLQSSLGVLIVSWNRNRNNRDNLKIMEFKINSHVFHLFSTLKKKIFFFFILAFIKQSSHYQLEHYVSLVLTVLLLKRGTGQSMIVNLNFIAKKHSPLRTLFFKQGHYWVRNIFMSCNT